MAKIDDIKQITELKKNLYKLADIKCKHIIEGKIAIRVVGIIFRITLLKNIVLGNPYCFLLKSNLAIKTKK